MSGSETSFVESSRLGVLILSAFAVVWTVAAVGLSSLPLGVSITAAVITVVAAVGLNVGAARRRFAPTDESLAPMTPQRRRTVFIVTNAAQAILFSVTISVCIALGEYAYIPILGSIIVGAHFIPIGLSFAERTFIVGGVVLMASGGLGLIAALAGWAAAPFVVGLVCLINTGALVALALLLIAMHGSPTPTPSPTSSNSRRASQRT